MAEDKGCNNGSDIPSLTLDELLARERELKLLRTGLDEEFIDLGLTESVCRSIHYEHKLKEYLAQNRKLITVAGNVGLGKTTFTRILVHSLGIEGIYELVDAKRNDHINDQLLNDFLRDKPKHCFALQQHLLHKRLALRTTSYNKGVSCVEDRTPEEDPGMFYLLFHEQGYLTDAQLDQLTREAIIAYDPAPKSDLMIVLQGSAELSRDRILQRARKSESQAWPLEELEIMARLYQNFPRMVPKYGLHQGPIIQFNLDKLDITNRVHEGYMFKQILLAFGEKTD
jgi:deoxyadenosine/deoxycytidine kinase